MGVPIGGGVEFADGRDDVAGTSGAAAEGDGEANGQSFVWAKASPEQAAIKYEAISKERALTARRLCLNCYWVFAETQRVSRYEQRKGARATSLPVFVMLLLMLLIMILPFLLLPICDFKMGGEESHALQWEFSLRPSASDEHEHEHEHDYEREVEGRWAT